MLWIVCNIAMMMHLEADASGLNADSFVWVAACNHSASSHERGGKEGKSANKAAHGTCSCMGPAILLVA